MRPVRRPDTVPAWHVATVAELARETPHGRRVLLDVPTWPGNEAGQHLDVRLTAPDGYQASRSYSVATAGPGTAVEIAVDRVSNGEVSPFLVDELAVSDRIEVHGPLGGWFVWHPDGDRPALLVAGGSGVVPMVAMARRHAATGDGAHMRLVHAVRSPQDAFYADELCELATGDPLLDLHTVYSRQAPPGSARAAGRLTRAELAALAIPAQERPQVFVCGATPFVEQVLTWLGELGYDSDDVRAERFGGAG